MKKVIIVNSCRECPHAHCYSIAWNLWKCDEFGIQLLTGETDGFHVELPDTIHPDCKLNDFPDVEQISQMSRHNKR